MNKAKWLFLIFFMVQFSSCDTLGEFLYTTPETGISDLTMTPLGTIPTTSETITPEQPTQAIQPPSATPLPEASITPDQPSLTPSFTPTDDMALEPTSVSSEFNVQTGSPVGVPNFSNPDLACQWMGLAGQVFDVDSQPLKDMVIEVGGTLAGRPIFGLAITGEESAYGPGGYEIKLADEPIASEKTVLVQVFDLDGKALSAPIYFPTYGSCEKNLIILNFVRSDSLPKPWVYLPVIFNDAMQE
jgi:hypothetical protein